MRELAKYKTHDPSVDLSSAHFALRVLIESLPGRAVRLSGPARCLLAERARDAADLIERGEV
ncbi:hypothetical protein XI06_14230 [Bradyrhizobium sp. CCBAU 11434]|nr:hypothetical protein [Bradyrhizobium sp. CCBAU 11434]